MRCVSEARNIDPLVHKTNTLIDCLFFNQYMSFLSIEMSILVNLQSNELIILEEACVALSMGKG